MPSIENYIPPFSLLLLGLILGGLFGDESVVGVIGGGMFVWGFFWTIRIWGEQGEAIRLLRERDRAERMARLVEQVECERRR